MIVLNIFRYLLENKKFSHVLVRIANTDATTSVKIEGLVSRTVGLTAHYVGTIVEPPYVSRVPSSEDGEVFHTFVIGFGENDRTINAFSLRQKTHFGAHSKGIVNGLAKSL